MNGGLAQGERLISADLLWLLGSLCQFHRIPFDPLLIKRQFLPPCSAVTLQSALIALGFKVGTLTLMPGSGGIKKLPLPAIGFLKETQTAPAQIEQAPQPSSASHTNCRQVCRLTRW
jgi:ATP-binding cassette, subfamily B, bacterial HlyB/CyaB